ncbi:carboxyl transferase domain-containing protein [Luteococcus peritonei]|uniref:Acetyl-coenzyme A carboxylase carboxyl transferase subunits beta/alpha n=1 Tax=Luteococcus peritonei TaxID=88874 RepID=A0ABW4RU92_9ACTN
MAQQRPGAQEILTSVLDEASFEAFPTPVQHPVDALYAQELEQARAATGLDEAVLCGTGTLDGRRVVVMAGEFGFLGGSVGVTTSNLLLQAADHATAEGLPLLALPCSGGTRMQEGTPAFVQMVKIGQAVLAHRRAGLPFLVHLRHPTTGGVLASWASLGQVTTAQPGALVGFLGPRVQEAITGSRIPEGVQRAEHVVAHGIVDAVVPDEELRALWSRLLQVLDPTHRSVGLPSGWAGAAGPPPGPAPSDAWQAVLTSRQEGRPGFDELTAELEVPLWLSVTGDGQVGEAIRVGLADLGGRNCVLVGTRREAWVLPADLRLAQRGFRLAQELGLPVVTVIDTPGAALTEQAEDQALSGEIARTLGALAELEVPTVSVLMGRGSGGAALALLPADRTLCAQHGWLAPLAPEGASAIMHRTEGHADQMARSHRISADELQAAGVVDEVVPEPADLAAEGTGFCRALVRAVDAQLDLLDEVSPAERLAARLHRFRSFG